MSDIEIRYLLALESSSSRWADQRYDHAFELTSSAELMPFEPFLSLIRQQCRLQVLEIPTLLANAGFPLRLAKILNHWILGSSSVEVEPTNPDQYHFEQRMYRLGLASVLHQLTQQQPLKVLINNAQFLSVSSCELLDELMHRYDTRLDIDLQSQPQAMAQWWPETEPQRCIRQNFTTSALSVPATTVEPVHAISFDGSCISDALYWADRLYCGNELQLLAEWQEQHSPELHNEFQLLLFRIRAKTYLNVREDALTLVNTLKQMDWSVQTVSAIEQGYCTTFMTYLWFKEFREAYRRGISHEKWASDHGLPEYRLYARVLRFWGQCLSGNFRFMASDANALEADLLAFGWLDLHALVSASYWYDLQSVPEHCERYVQACHKAIDLAIEQQNSLSLAKYYHHLSVVLQQQGKTDKAIHFLERSISQSRANQNNERLHAGLNGMAYLQLSSGRFAEARTAILEALPLVLAEGNYEQIVTTLVNGVLTLFYAGDMSNSIAMLDDIFTIMHLRGLPNTRFRGRFELKAMQATAHLLRGEMDIAIAQYQHVRREPVLSTDGHYFVGLMDIIVRCNKGVAPVQADLERLLTMAEEVHRSPLLELLVRKVIDVLQQAKYPLLRFNKNTESAQRLVADFQINSDLLWFAHPHSDPAENQIFVEQIRSFNTIEHARKESLVGFVKLENSLLKLIVETRTIAKSCATIEEFFDACLKRLMRTVNISYLSLEVDMANGKRYSSNLSQAYEFSDHRLPNDYRFSYSEGVGTFSVLVDAGLEIYSAELRIWAQKIVEAMVELVEELLAEQESSGLAFTDYLTGAYNRAAFDRLDQQVNIREMHQFVLCYLDLDNFKDVNDRFGHARGDQLLKSFVQLVQGYLGSDDRVYRIGGDEFILLIPNQVLTEVEPTLHRIIDEMERVFRRSDDKENDMAINVGCSIGALGVHNFVDQPGAMAKMVYIADHQMYQAKHSGKNRVVCDQLEFNDALARFAKLDG